MKSTTSRFQVVDSLFFAPGESLITKTSTGRFIDTQLALGMGERPAFRGHVYLSEGEVLEMAQQLGLFDDYERQIDEATDEQKTAATYEQGWEAGYAAGRAENLDNLADELVDRMRARVGRDRAERAAGESAGADGSAAAPAAGSGAEAAVGEDADGVRGAGAGDDTGTD